MIKPKHRIRRNIWTSTAGSTFSLYKVERKVFWWPWWETTYSTYDFSAAQKAYQRAIETGHSEIFTKGEKVWD